MFKCLECGEKFEEPKKKKICYEIEYGVATLFDNTNYVEILICPYCHENNYIRIKEEEENEERSNN